MRNINSEDRRKLRVELCRRANGKCDYCKASIGMSGTVDHHLPQAHGGTNAKSNLRWSCRCCNAVKGDMSPAEWAEFLPIMQRQAKLPERDRIALLTMVARRARGLEA